MNLAEDNFKAAQCMIMANGVISSEADWISSCSSSIKVAIHQEL